MSLTSKWPLIVLVTTLVIAASATGHAQSAPLLVTAAPQPSPPPAASTAQAPAAAAPAKKPEPFAFADFTWLSGNPRTKESPIDTSTFFSCRNGDEQVFVLHINLP